MIARSVATSCLASSSPSHVSILRKSGKEIETPLHSLDIQRVNSAASRLQPVIRADCSGGHRDPGPFDSSRAPRGFGHGKSPVQTRLHLEACRKLKAWYLFRLAFCIGFRSSRRGIRNPFH
jgi:hypothetical protein